jgi:hypothetical protein
MPHHEGLTVVRAPLWTPEAGESRGDPPASLCPHWEASSSLGTPLCPSGAQAQTEQRIGSLQKPAHPNRARSQHFLSPVGEARLSPQLPVSPRLLARANASGCCTLASSPCGIVGTEAQSSRGTERRRSSRRLPSPFRGPFDEYMYCHIGTVWRNKRDRGAPVVRIKARPFWRERSGAHKRMASLP